MTDRKTHKLEVRSASGEVLGEVSRQWCDQKVARSFNFEVTMAQNLEDGSFYWVEVDDDDAFCGDKR